MPKIWFDEREAAFYDAAEESLANPAPLEPVIDFLADLAGDGDALELAIGTGRIALPLRRRGVRVWGIDISEPMVAKLREKPGADDIDVMIGDIATARFDRTFRLAYLVYNTIENLTTQAEQVECFRSAAAQLEPGGSFVIEVEVPDLQRLPPGETVRPFEVTERHLGFDEFDLANQGLWSHHYWIFGDRTERFSMPFRYVWPSELDLMAQLAGMSLRERWGGWSREPFTSDSRKHVSVWEKPAEA
jgi:hypothetical protein